MAGTGGQIVRPYASEPWHLELVSSYRAAVEHGLEGGMTAVRPKTGFRRIGIVVAVPLLLVAAGFGITAGVAAYKAQFRVD
jgi:hypothetical protein